MHGRVAALIASMAVPTLAAGCTSAGPGGPAAQPPSSAAPPQGGSAGVESVAEGLETPWSIAFRGEAALIRERDSGRILELAADGTAGEVGVVDGATPMGEGGLLGIAVHEDYLYALTADALAQAELCCDRAVRDFMVGLL